MSSSSSNNMSHCIIKCYTCLVIWRKVFDLECPDGVAKLHDTLHPISPKFLLLPSSLRKSFATYQKELVAHPRFVGMVLGQEQSPSSLAICSVPLTLAKLKESIQTLDTDLTHPFTLFSFFTYVHHLNNLQCHLLDKTLVWWWDSSPIRS